jgi:hypothetical protein
MSTSTRYTEIWNSNLESPQTRLYDVVSILYILYYMDLQHRF